MSFQLIFSQVIPYIPLLLQGLKLSIFITAVGMVLGSGIGVLCAVARINGNKIVKKVVNIYIEIFRNTPLLVQMYLMFFGFAQFGVQVSAMLSAILALTLNTGAYTGVIFETGLNDVNSGQREAAAALGMTNFQTFSYIIIPQGFRIVIPPLTNQFISLFLFSSVASTVSVPELLSQTLRVDSMTMRTFEVFIITTILYLAVTTAITILSNLHENSYKY